MSLPHPFHRQEGDLYCEQLPLASLAERFATPCYVYSQAAIRGAMQAYQQGLGQHPGLICYAVKANSNLAVLNTLAQLGAGFDIVSQGELARVLAAGGDPKRVVFSGVAKTANDMTRALQAGIHCFNVESAAELRLLSQVAEGLGVQAPIALRVNPNVDPQTHPYISTGLKENKFGIDIDLALDLYRTAAADPNLMVKGVACHIGSQLLNIQPLLDATDLMLQLIDQLASDGIALQHLDMGGGLGVAYRDDEQAPNPAEYVPMLLARLQGRSLALHLEPGRSIVADAGVLLTQVVYLKETGQHHFAVVDAAMNDLLRPSLYGAYQAIETLAASDQPSRCYDVVGPICETGDFLGKQRQLALQAGDFLAVRQAGAYGFVMASNYNSRGLCAEIMVQGDQAFLIKPRQDVQQLFANETLVPGS